MTIYNRSYEHIQDSNQSLASAQDKELSKKRQAMDKYINDSQYRQIKTKNRIGGIDSNPLSSENFRIETENSKPHRSINQQTSFPIMEQRVNTNNSKNSSLQSLAIESVKEQKKFKTKNVSESSNDYNPKVNKKGLENIKIHSSSQGAKLKNF